MSLYIDNVVKAGPESGFVMCSCEGCENIIYIGDFKNYQTKDEPVILDYDPDYDEKTDDDFYICPECQEDRCRECCVKISDEDYHMEYSGVSYAGMNEIIAGGHTCGNCGDTVRY